MSTINLPDTPSELILLALKDLKKVEKDPKYKVGMGTWHFPHSTACYVCLAGSVMAKSFKSKVDWELSPSYFSGSTANKLHALDEFRQGQVVQALERFSINTIDLDRNVVEYKNNPELFVLQLTNIAKELALLGY